jgi:peptidoglycan hydrolase-like protein with peptidoglycan-binding domain
VTALQNFLLADGFSIPAGATGYFGAQTKTAVTAFQKAHGLAQVGIVGPQTRALLNQGSVPTAPETVTSSSASLTAVQVQAILSLLQAFGADAATVTNVEAALGGK